MKLSKQANGTLLMALQKCLLEQSDITDILDNLDFDVDSEGQLVVNNPPSFRVDDPTESENIAKCRNTYMNAILVRAFMKLGTR